MDFGDVIANQPVVIDNVRAPLGTNRDGSWDLAQGSGVIKAGFAGDRAPKSVFQSLYVNAAPPATRQLTDIIAAVWASPSTCVSWPAPSRAMSSLARKPRLVRQIRPRLADQARQRNDAAIVVML